MLEKENNNLHGYRRSEWPLFRPKTRHTQTVHQSQLSTTEISADMADTLR